MLLAGHEFDVQDWREELPTQFDPAVIEVPDENAPGGIASVLRSSEFDGCSSSAEVRKVASYLVPTLSGLIAVRRKGARPVGPGRTVYEFPADGSVRRHMSIEPQPGEIRLRGSAVLLRHCGERVEEPKPSCTQWLANRVSGDLREALHFYNRADNWFDLFKSLEAVQHHVGGRDKLKEFGFTREELSSLGASPQHVRHYKSTANPPRLLTLEQARDLMRRILEAVLSGL